MLLGVHQPEGLGRGRSIGMAEGVLDDAKHWDLNLSGLVRLGRIAELRDLFLASKLVCTICLYY